MNIGGNQIKGALALYNLCYFLECIISKQNVFKDALQKPQSHHSNSTTLKLQLASSTLGEDYKP